MKEKAIEMKDKARSKRSEMKQKIEEMKESMIKRAIERAGKTKFVKDEVDKKAQPHLEKVVIGATAELLLGVIVLAWIGGCCCFRWCACAYRKPGHKDDTHAWVTIPQYDHIVANRSKKIRN